MCILHFISPLKHSAITGTVSLHYTKYYITNDITSQGKSSGYIQTHDYMTSNAKKASKGKFKTCDYIRNNATKSNYI